MSDLKPKGIPVEIGGQERHFLMTLNVVDAIQSEFTEIERDGDVIENPNLLEIFVYVFGKNTQLKDYKDLCKLTALLMNDEAERNKRMGGEQFDKVTAEDVGYMLDIESVPKITNAIMEAYGISMPEPDEDSDPNTKGGQSK